MCMKDHTAPADRTSGSDLKVRKSSSLRALIRGSLALSFALALGAISSEACGQWPQWGGPNRNFEVDTSALAAEWPKEGPKRLWHRPLGDGYSTVTVADGKLYTMYRKDGKEYTISLDAKTGKTLWEKGESVEVTKLMTQFGEGPHSTPLISGDRLFTIGVNCLLRCFESKTGEVLWQHDLAKEFGMEIPGRGYSSSPIEYKDTIILPVGGKAGQSMMAFDKSTGKVVWKNQDFEPTHSSPILIEFHGKPQLIVFMGAELVGLNPEDGSLLWQQEHPTQYGANLATPVWDGKDILFFSAAYNSGSRCIKLVMKDGKVATEELWFSKKMRIHHGNVILAGGYAYGSSGDFGPAFLMCADLLTGKLAWRERGFAKSTFLHGAGKLIILDQDGQLGLAEISPQGIKVRSRCKIAEPYAWAAPTLVGTILYVRDREHIMALDLG